MSTTEKHAEPKRCWQCRRPAEHATRYGLTRPLAYCRQHVPSLLDAFRRQALAALLRGAAVRRRRLLAVSLKPAA